MHWLSATNFILLSACKFGGGISGGLGNIPHPVKSVAIPVIGSPSSSIYYSKDSSVTLSGFCGIHTEVLINGSTTQTLACSDSGTFQFTLQQSNDGVYAYSISQRDISNQVSESVPFTWIRKTSVPPPALTNPTTTSFSSGLTTITLSGTCETKNIIRLEGDAVGSTTCANSLFSINVSKAVFGTYNINLIQEDPAGNTAALALAWNRAALNVSPASAMLPVATAQVLTISGGDGVYTVIFDENNSGATFNSVTRTYTSGIIANVTDHLTIKDSDGLAGSLAITTVAAAPDHLTMDAWSDPTYIIGQPVADPLTVKVVDQYGNGVPNISIIFQSLVGDLSFLSSPFPLSNAAGEATLSYKMGQNLQSSQIKVLAKGVPLPDVAGTGNATFKLKLHAATLGDGAFGPRYATGSGPQALKLHDFDGDGFQDAAFLQSGTNEFVIKKGKADGLFAGPVKYALSGCSDATDFIIADFDSDDIRDVLVLCAGTATMARLKGLANGTFLPMATIGGISNQNAFVAFDFDEDSILDLAILSGANGELQIHMGAGDFTFAHFTTVATTGYPQDIQLADVDKNGHPDLILTNNVGNNVTVFLNSGLANFGVGTDVIAGLGPTKARLADLNQDTFLDLIILNRDEWSASVYLNDGNGAFEFESNVQLGDSPSNLEIFDYDGDGNLDILSTNDNDLNFGLLIGLGNGQFQSMTTFDAFGAVNSLALGDINADGLKDLLYLNSTTEELMVLPRSQTSGFGSHIDLAKTPIKSGAADFNLDGIQDLYFLNSDNTVSFYRGLAGGGYQWQLNMATGSGPVDAVVVDLNHDTWPDIIIANNSSHTFSVYYGGEDWVFSDRIDFPTTLNPSALSVRDFNGDGLLDVAASGTGLAKISVSLGSVDDIFTAKMEYACGSSPQDLQSADINEDGFIDLVSADQGGNSVSLLLGNGDGTFRNAVTINVGSAPIRVVIDDFNRDGALDLITLNSDDGGIAYLRGNGDGTFAAPSSTFAGGTPVAMQSGDLNGDGFTDIVVSNGNGNSITVLYVMNGAFNNTETINVGMSVESLLLSDLNKDGIVDLEFINNPTAKATIWLGH